MPKIDVSFSDTLPLGTCGSFDYKGERWIAYPLPKMSRIWAVMDRMAGIYSRLTQDMLRWLNSHPGDAELVVMLAEQVTRAKQLYAEVAVEKGQATTWIVNTQKPVSSSKS